MIALGTKSKEGHLPQVSADVHLEGLRWWELTSLMLLQEEKHQKNTWVLCCKYPQYLSWVC